VTNRSASVLFRMLDLKNRHPLPDVDVLPASFDFSLDRKQQCVSIEEFDRFEQDYPLWGMPFGLPGLSDAERARLVGWLEQGAPFEGPAPLPPAVEGEISDWEQFLNGDSLKEQLTSRYLYEHLFLAHLHFDSDPDTHYFRLVRSRTPPGQPVREIATRRPYDGPGVSRVFYRLTPERETLVAKTHMPYALNPERMALWRELFLTSDYNVDTLPSYAPDDHFWVFFVAPDAISEEVGAEFLARESRNLSLPSEKGSTALILSTWLEFSRREDDYLRAKSEFLQHKFNKPSKVTLDLVWDGDGRNRNAALTVFRHFNSASVVKGLVGKPPKTAWLISYPLLERIHYLLVAGFDV
jgi:hypothetical protein